MTVCGFAWTTRDKAGLHEHVCRRDAGHATTWHGCLEDAGKRHVIERRLRD